MTFTVIKKVSQLRSGNVVHHYTFKRAESIKQPRIYNKKLQGTQIEGKVLAVQGDRVKVHLSIDEAQDTRKAYDYKFATSYTSEGQTGWYCMPELGSSVMLYCRTSDERMAYINKINREDGEENEKVNDPDIKYFGTAYGKELQLKAGNKIILKTKGASVVVDQIVHINS